MGNTHFVAGVYGVGKSILCNKLAEKMRVPFFSAGDLISEANGETYGANKTVADKENNQRLLAKKVQKLNQEYRDILLAGHFCIFDSSNKVDVLPEPVFQALEIEQIVLLEADKNIVVDNLKKRDNIHYSSDSIEQLIMTERKQAIRLADKLNCRLSIYQMSFSDKDVHHVMTLMMQGGLR